MSPCVTHIYDSNKMTRDEHLKNTIAKPSSENKKGVNFFYESLTCIPFSPKVIKLDRLLSRAIFKAIKHTLRSSCDGSLCMPCCL